MPDQVLDMLQVGSNCKLTSEQYFVAKLKSLELASIKGEITISDFKGRVRKVVVGQTMASLNPQILKGVKIILPCKKEQDALRSWRLRYEDRHCPLRHGY